MSLGEVTGFLFVAILIGCALGWWGKSIAMNSKNKRVMDENTKSLKALNNAELQIRQLNRSLDNTRSQYRTKQDALTESNHRLKLLHQRLADRDQAIKNLKQQTATLGRRKEAELAQLRSQLQTFEPSDAHRKMKQAIVERDRMRNELEWQTQQKDSAVSRFQEQIRKADAIQVENEHKSQSIEELNRIVNQLQTEHANITNGLQSRIRELEIGGPDHPLHIELNAVRAEMNHIQLASSKEIQNLQSSIALLEPLPVLLEERDNEVAKLQSTLKEELLRLETSENETVVLKSSHDELEANQRTLRNEIKRLQEEYQLQLTELETAQQQAKLFGDEKLELEEKLRNADIQIQRLASQEQSSTQSHDDLSRIQEEKQQLEEKYLRAQQSVSVLEPLNREQAITIQNLHKAAAKRESVIGELEKSKSRPAEKLQGVTHQLESVEALKRHIAQQTQTIQDLQTNENRLKQLLVEAEQNLALENTNISQSTEDKSVIGKVNLDVELNSKQIHQRLSTFEKLRSELSVRDSNIVSLQRGVSDLTSKLSVQQHEHLLHKNRLGQLEKSLHDKETENQHAEEKIKALTDQEQLLQKQLEALESVRDELIQRDAVIVTLQDEVSGFKQAQIKSSQTIENKNTELNSLQQLTAQHEAQLENASASNSKLRSELELLQSRLVALEGIRNELTSRDENIAQLQRHYETDKTQSVDRLANLEQELTSLTLINDNLKKQIQATQSDNKEQTKLASRHQQIIADLRNKLTAERSTTLEVENALPTALNQVESLLESEQPPSRMDTRTTSAGALKTNNTKSQTGLDKKNSSQQDNTSHTLLTTPGDVGGTHSEADKAHQSSVSTPPANGKDDLQRIHGIGPKIEKILNSMGVSTFKQIAEFTEQDVERIADKMPAFPNRIQKDHWIDSAQKEYQQKYE